MTMFIFLLADRLHQVGRGNHAEVRGNQAVGRRKQTVGSRNQPAGRGIIPRAAEPGSVSCRGQCEPGSWQEEPDSEPGSGQGNNAEGSRQEELFSVPD
jgi:hypothetical protein